MRLDKFTTKFQQALSDAQSLAIGNDQQFIEPQHLLLALINQDDGGKLRCFRVPASMCQACARIWNRR
jgi:ATP-dependent Clp protease ATP-binding subunit ClpA